MSIFTIDMNIEKSITINASKEEIWQYISNSEKQNIWSPWFILERDCKQVVEGNPDEVGYTVSWEGKYVGKGEEILEEVEKYNYRKYALNFIKPFKSKNHDSYRLEEISEKETKIIWSMTGTLPFFLFFMKKMMVAMIGSDFDRGLLMLKTLVETGSLDTETHYIGTETLEQKYYIASRGEGEQEEIEKNMGDEFFTLAEFVKENNIEALSFFSKYNKTDLINKYFEYEVCAEISAEAFRSLEGNIDSPFFTETLPEMKVSKTTHLGTYNFLGNSWTGSYMFLEPNGLKEDKKCKPMEVYEKGPFQTTEEKDHITHILVPIK